MSRTLVIRIFCLGIALGLLGFGGIVNAQSLLVNGDFETPSVDPGNPVPGWTVSGTGDIEENGEGATTPNQSAAFNVRHDWQGTVLSQSFATTARMVYRVTFDSGIYGVPGATLQMDATVLGSGGVTLAQRTVFPPAAFTFDPSAVIFRHYAVLFT